MKKITFILLTSVSLLFSNSLGDSEKSELEHLNNSIKYFNTLPEEVQNSILKKNPKAISDIEIKIKNIKNGVEKKEKKVFKINKNFVYDAKEINNLLVMRVQKGNIIKNISINKNFIYKNTFNCSGNICSFNDIYKNVYIVNKNSKTINKLIKILNIK